MSLFINSLFIFLYNYTHRLTLHKKDAIILMRKKILTEKIIIKNGMFILFFITNQMSPYYKSKQFSKVLERVAADQRFAFKQSEGKLKLITRGIDSTSAALEALKKLQ